MRLQALIKGVGLADAMALALHGRVYIPAGDVDERHPLRGLVSEDGLRWLLAEMPGEFLDPPPPASVRRVEAHRAAKAQLRGGRSIREIARRTGLHRKTVASIKRRMEDGT